MHRSRFSLPVLLGVMALMSAGLVTSCVAGPTITVGRAVPSGQRKDMAEVDHSPWNSLLGKYVDEKGWVAYAAWKSSAEGRAALENYLNSLSAGTASPTTTQEARLAFWINAYNALTVHGILREYPTTSIRNHTAKIYGYNIWKNLHLQVAGKPYSLEQIEHEVLRKMHEPRIHFAIVCASVGCPRLLNEAYVPDRIDEQLTRNAKSFFSDPSKLRVDVSNSKLAVSPILSWFATDFGPTNADQLRTIAPWLPASASALAKEANARISYLDYDWSLNDKEKAGR